MNDAVLGTNTTLTPDEAVVSYRQAKDKPAQIGILADLCCTSKEEIVRILVDAGCTDDNGDPPRLPGIREEDMPDIVRMRAEGKSFSYIAGIYGCSGPTVSKKLNEWQRSAKRSSAPKNVSEDEEEGHMSVGKVRLDAGRRLAESMEIDKDFYRDILELYELLRVMEYRYPGISVVCTVEDGAAVAYGEYCDLCVKYRGGGDADGESDAEQG